MNTSYSGSISSTASDSFLTSLLSATSLTATLERSSTFENDDVAILHVPASDTPFIPLGDSGDVAVQDHLTVIGFPGNADFFHPDGTYDPTDLLTPSFNTLYVSAIKSGVTGDTLLQVGGNIEHGDSGGPALNAAGQIVGVVSYSGTDTPVGTFFLRTSNDASVLVKQAGLATQAGQLETQWTQAIDDYSSSAEGHWHTAARELGNLETNYPAFRGVTPYRDYATQAASTEKASSTITNRMLVVGVIAIAALLILILILVLILVLRRGRKSPAYATYPSYSPYPQTGAPGGPLAPPFTPMQMPTSAEMVDLTRRPYGTQQPSTPYSSPLTANGAGTGGAAVSTPVAVGAAAAPQVQPYAGQYAPQPFSAPATPSLGGAVGVVTGIVWRDGPPGGVYGAAATPNGGELLCERPRDATERGLLWHLRRAARCEWERALAQRPSSCMNCYGLSLFVGSFCPRGGYVLYSRHEAFGASILYFPRLCALRGTVVALIKSACRAGLPRYSAWAFSGRRNYHVRARLPFVRARVRRPANAHEGMWRGGSGYYSARHRGWEPRGGAAMANIGWGHGGPAESDTGILQALLAFVSQGGQLFGARLWEENPLTLTNVRWHGPSSMTVDAFRDPLRDTSLSAEERDVWIQLALTFPPVPPTQPGEEPPWMPLRVDAEKAAQWAQSVRQAQARERARPPAYSGPIQASTPRMPAVQRAADSGWTGETTRMPRADEPRIPSQAPYEPPSRPLPQTPLPPQSRPYSQSQYGQSQYGQSQYASIRMARCRARSRASGPAAGSRARWISLR